MDIVIPIVFPDYKVAIEVEKTKVDVFPWVDFDNFTIPKYSDKISNLGHAGVLFINGKTGTTKYYEYGRYDPQNIGLVIKVRNLPDVQILNGSIVIESLKKPLAFISRVSGQSGRIQGVYIEVENKFKAMLEFANLKKMQNGNPKRIPYDIWSNSCIHFVKAIVAKAGVSAPWMIDPRPNSYIGEFRDEFSDLDYSGNVLIIENMGKY